MKMVSEKTKQAIRQYLSLNEYFKNSFYWRPPSSASCRRGYETKNSMEFEGDSIELCFKVRCSCNNIYVDKCITIDGKKTNATALKKFVK